MIKLLFGGLVVLLPLVFFREKNPEIAGILAIAGTLFLVGNILFLVGDLKEQLAFFYHICQEEIPYVTVLWKMLGITLLTEQGAALCKDCNQQSLAQGLMTAGKLSLLLESVPVLLALVGWVNELW